MDSNRNDNKTFKILKNITLSGFVLILANFAPVIGVVFFDWAPLDIIFIYWLETLFIGLFNIIKMIFAPEEKNILKFFTIPFFIIFFGAFQAGQGVFILEAMPYLIHQLTGEQIEIAIVGYVEYLFWPALALFLSHLFSLIWNFFLMKEYKRAKISILFSKPIKRVVFQQFVVIGGCNLLMTSKNPMLLMILVILAKIYIDLNVHLKSHKPTSEVEPNTA